MAAHCGRGRRHGVQTIVVVVRRYHRLVGGPDWKLLCSPHVFFSAYHAVLKQSIYSYVFLSGLEAL